MNTKNIILYAEDDLDDVFIVNQVFEKHKDMKVIHAPNGKEALQALNELWLQKELPCLIVLDINMPVVDGKEALKQIKTSNEFTNIPVVLFSTSSNKDDSTFAQQWGAELITKPLMFNEFEHVAEEFLKRCNVKANGSVEGSSH